MPSDLTFQELKAALPANGVVVSNGTTALPAGVYINAGAVAGQTIDELTDTGVVETFVKLLNGANKAQTDANVNLTAGNRLNAFATPTFSNPTLDATSGQYTASITLAVTGRAPLNLDSLFGAQV